MSGADVKVVSGRLGFRLLAGGEVPNNTEYIGKDSQTVIGARSTRKIKIHEHLLGGVGPTHERPDNRIRFYLGKPPLEQETRTFVECCLQRLFLKRD